MQETRTRTAFVISDEDRERVREWHRDHNCRVAPDSFGSLLTYMFTPTGIGSTVIVTCPCGAKLDLTNYEDW